MTELSGADGRNIAGLLRTATVATGTYLCFSAWRLASLESYQEALANESSGNALAELYATSTELMYGNYALLLFFSVIILACAVKGVRSRDKIILKWHMCGDILCIVVLMFSIANLFLVGTLCTGNADNCDSLKTSFAFSLILSFLLLVMYSASYFFSKRLIISQSFDIIDLQTRPELSTQTSTSFRLTMPQPQSKSMNNQSSSRQIPAGEDDDNVPYAIPVYDD